MNMPGFAGYEGPSHGTASKKDPDAHPSRLVSQVRDVFSRDFNSLKTSSLPGRSGHTEGLFLLHGARAEFRIFQLTDKASPARPKASAKLSRPSFGFSL